ncbi:MAG: hypothetical protein ABIN79_14950 [Marmoricola sp.]
MSDDKQDDSNDSGSSDSDSTTEGDQRGISDEQLPEDLQPTDDNPLARHPGQTGDDDDKIGADTESGDAENPSTEITYGSGDSDTSQSSESSESSGDSEESGPTDAEEGDGSEQLENGGGGAG